MKTGPAWILAGAALLVGGAATGTGIGWIGAVILLLMFFGEDES